jgi:hypothetical protein
LPKFANHGRQCQPRTGRHYRVGQPQDRRLSQLFRGELDWIVMKALEKDRNRRYDTVSSFAADVELYLHDEPVLVVRRLRCIASASSPGRTRRPW